MNVASEECSLISWAQLSLIQHLKNYISLLKMFISGTVLKSGVIASSEMQPLSWKSL